MYCKAFHPLEKKDVYFDHHDDCTSHQDIGKECTFYKKASLLMKEKKIKKEKITLINLIKFFL